MSWGLVPEAEPFQTQNTGWIGKQMAFLCFCCSADQYWILIVFSFWLTSCKVWTLLLNISDFRETEVTLFNVFLIFMSFLGISYIGFTIIVAKLFQYKIKHDSEHFFTQFEGHKNVCSVQFTFQEKILSRRVFAYKNV